MTKTFNKIKVKTENIKIKSNLKMSSKAGMQGENQCFPVSLKIFLRYFLLGKQSADLV